MSRRLAATPNQVQRLLEVLEPFGFVATRMEITPDGAIIFRTESDRQDPDLLLAWEAHRAARRS